MNLNAGQVLNAGNVGRPLNPLFGRSSDTNQIFGAFSSSYHSLQVKMDRRFSSGLSITTSFTWSKAMSYQTGDDGGLYYYYWPQVRRGYARADFDRKLNFVQSYIYQLPFGKGKPFLTSGAGSKVFGGWSLSGILSWRSGTPFNVTASSGLNLPSFNQTANLIGAYRVLGGIGNGNNWFDTSVFATPASLTFGNTGRNEFTGPNFFALNAGLRRQFRVREGILAEVRAEALNVTNTPQFSNPQGSITSSTFGQITSTLSTGTGVNGTGGGRNLNLSAKLTF